MLAIAVLAILKPPVEIKKGDRRVVSPMIAFAFT